MSAEVLAIVIPAITLLIGVLFSMRSKQFTRMKISNVEIEFSQAKEKVEPEYNNESRLTEIRTEMQRQVDLSKWNQRSDTALVFGQYIIGGVLASTFVQQSLSPHLVGGLGVLVLVSSLIRQKFRPNLLAQDSRFRVSTLRSLMREIEDDIYALKSNDPNAPTLIAIRKKATAGLAKIEATESSSNGSESDA